VAKAQGRIPSPPSPILHAKPMDLQVLPADVPEEKKAFELTDGQATAWKKLKRFVASKEDKDDFFVLRGFAGTGKTFLLQMLKDLNLYNILYTAPTNKAAKVLSSMLEVQAKTIYSALGIRMESEDDTVVLKYPDRLPANLRNCVLVIDEASMVGQQLLDFIKRAQYELNLKVIFVGDPAQLRPVGEDRSYAWAVTDRKENRALLTEVKRNDAQLLVLATALRQCLRTRQYDFDVADYVDGEQVKQVSQKELERMMDGDPDTRVLAWRNKTVTRYNRIIRKRLGFTEEFCIGDLLLLAGPMNEYDAQGEPVLIGNTDDELTVTQAILDYVTVQEVQIEIWKLTCNLDGLTKTLRIATDKGHAALAPLLSRMAAKARKFDKTKSSIGQVTWKDFWRVKNTFHRVRYGWALTAHRAQGSTMKRVLVDQADILANRETAEAFQCLYVTSTRPSHEIVFN